MGVGLTCREPGAGHYSPGLGATVHSLGMDTAQHGRGEADLGAQARGAQIFLLPSRDRSDGHRREPWFQ